MAGPLYSTQLMALTDNNLVIPNGLDAAVQNGVVGYDTRLVNINTGATTAAAERGNMTNDLNQLVADCDAAVINDPGNTATYLEIKDRAQNALYFI
jgi:hypothetical protein